MIFQIKTTTCPIYKNPNYESELVSEGILGEKINILEQNSEWAYIKLLTDSYKGFINLKNIGKVSEPTHRVICPKTIVLSNSDVKSKEVKQLSFGSLVSVEKFVGSWGQIKLIGKDNSISLCYIPKIHLIKINDKFKNWVYLAENLVGSPYKWGGRSSFGLDCSALLQLTMSFNGMRIPRDTKDQINFSHFREISIDKAVRGDLIFWKGHVAIFKDKEFIIHANANSMNVTLEHLNKALLRIEKKYGRYIAIKRFK